MKKLKISLEINHGEYLFIYTSKIKNSEKITKEIFRMISTVIEFKGEN